MPTPTTFGPVHSYTYSKTAYIDALLDTSVYKWGTGGAGTAAAVTYSFPDDDSYWSTASYGPPSGGGEPWWPDYAPLDAGGQAAFEAALDAWSEVANIRFTQVVDDASTVGDIRVAYSGLVGDEGAAAWAYYPWPDPAGGDVWLDPGYAPNHDFDPGGYGYLILLHEIGHALGLDHSFDGPYRLSSAQDSDQYTVMSYTKSPYATIYPSEPSLYDVAAIQYLYGANMTTRTGDDVYSYSAATEVRDTIWDAGGIDTIDASNQSLGVAINLNEGTFSSIGVKNGGGAAQQNVAIAYKAGIENAIGGPGNDVLTGNALDNVLTGNDGNDRLTGGGGNDMLIGGAGNDTLSGGAGRDVIIYDPNDGSVLGDGDSDTLLLDFGATVNLGNSTDQVTGGGKAQGFESVDASGSAAAVTLTGSSAANRLVGGAGNDTLGGGKGSDVLVGGPGADLLSGGAGKDTFDFNALADGGDTITDFKTGSKGDILDLADILIGYDSGDPVASYLALKAGGSGTILQVDADGGADAFEDFITLRGLAGLTLDKLLAGGNLDLLA